MVVPRVTHPGPVEASTTMTLVPNGAGYYTDCTLHYSPTNWQACETQDGHSSYVSSIRANNQWDHDLYELTDPDPGIEGTIHSVTVHIYAWTSYYPDGYQSAVTTLRTHDSNRTGTMYVLTVNEWEDYSRTWTTNPVTGSAWTWDEIAALQAGVGLRSADSFGGPYPSLCSAVWAVVSYTQSNPSVTTEEASSIGETYATLNGSLDVLGTASTVDVSFEWGEESGTYTHETTPETLSATGTFDADLTSLTAGTDYFFRAKAVGDGTRYGDEVCLTTSGADYNVPSATETGTVTFTSDLGTITQLEALAEEDLPAECDPFGLDFPHGLFQFEIVGVEPGATVDVTIVCPSVIPEGTVYRECINGEWVDIPIVSGIGTDTITIQLTDGGLGDADETEDGNILDPSGPADAEPMVTVDLDLKTGWNMVSVPVVTGDMSTGEIFPGVDAVYTWDPGAKSYSVPSEIEPALGYWVAVSSDQILSIEGIPMTDWTDAISTGWNMIGSVHGGSVSFSDPDDDPDGSCEGFVYSWDPTTKSYVYGTTVETGKGYWAACTSSCDLTVGPPGP